MKSKLKIPVVMFCLGTTLGFFFGAGIASAHSVLETPVPRSNNSGNQLAPCGPYLHTTPTVYQAGSTITVTWEETIHHSGSFQIFFSPANDQNLSVGTNPVPGPTPIFSVPQTFTDDNVPHQYSGKVTLPNTPCVDCTLQLVQVATDNGVNNPFYYFSCADITLTTTAPSPTPTPTPTPGPVACASPASTATFTAVNSTVIQPLCVSCHSGANPPGNYSFSTYAGVLGAVNTTTPTLSPLYQTTNDGAMPENGPVLTTTQESLLLQWIQAGAPNN